jgi:ADP-heptose:LPS heptosyltransferase
MPSEYAFKSPFRRTAARILDVAGKALIKPWLRRRRQTSPPEKLLVLRLDHLGDVIGILPLLEQIASWPKPPHVTVAVNPTAAVLLRDTPWIDQVLPFEAPWFSRNPNPPAAMPALKQFARRLRAESFDAAVDLRGDARNIFMLALAGIPFRVGYGQTGGGFLLHRELRWIPSQAMIDRNLAALIPFRVQPPFGAAAHLSWTARPEERDWLSAITSGKPVVAIHADAGTPAKRWPVDHWAALLRETVSEDMAVVLCGATASIGDALVRALAGRPLVDLMGKTTLPQLVTLLQSSQAVITTDSGPAHIAAALGRPTFIFWSGTNRPEIWLPRGDHVEWRRHDVPCQPCGLERCPLPRHLCMDDLRPEAAAASVRSFIQQAIERRGSARA